MPPPKSRKRGAPPTICKQHMAQVTLGHRREFNIGTPVACESCLSIHAEMQMQQTRMPHATRPDNRRLQARVPEKMAVALTVNGAKRQLKVAPWTTLLDALRDHL